MTVDGSTRVSREEASGILAETPPITEGPETERSQHILHQNNHLPLSQHCRQVALRTHRQIKCVDIKNANKHVCLHVNPSF